MQNILNKFKVHPSTYYFILLCFLCGLFKNILILYMIIIIHEIGHIITIKLFNYRIEYIIMYPFGGITYINKLLNSSITKDLIISISGVLFQCIVVNILLNTLTFNSGTYNIINIYNKTIMIFNLFPIVPLDGSKISFNLFSYFFSYKTSYFLMVILSIIALIIFINYNIIYSLNNYLIILILILYIYKYIKDFKYVFNKFLIERIMYNFKYNKIINRTKDIMELRKEKYHYFKEGNKYISESKKIQGKFDKNNYF